MSLSSTFKKLVGRIKKIENKTIAFTDPGPLGNKIRKAYDQLKSDDPAVRALGEKKLAEVERAKMIAARVVLAFFTGGTSEAWVEAIMAAAQERRVRKQIGKEEDADAEAERVFQEQMALLDAQTQEAMRRQLGVWDADPLSDERVRIPVAIQPHGLIVLGGIAFAVFGLT